MRHFKTVFCTLALLSLCVAARAVWASEPATGKLQRSLLMLSDELATAISSCDADGAARGFQKNDHVAYVSDGAVIRGRELRDVLQRFYSGMRQIEFRWDKREVQAFGKAGGVVTGWAAISLVDTQGKQTADKALFTLVYVRSHGAWELVTAHKTTLP